jgi:hypothetical protein
MSVRVPLTHEDIAHTKCFNRVTLNGIVTKGPTKLSITDVADIFMQMNDYRRRHPLYETLDWENPDTCYMAAVALVVCSLSKEEYIPLEKQAIVQKLIDVHRRLRPIPFFA